MGIRAFFLSSLLCLPKEQNESQLKVQRREDVQENNSNNTKNTFLLIFSKPSSFSSNKGDVHSHFFSSVYTRSYKVENVNSLLEVEVPLELDKSSITWLLMHISISAMLLQLHAI
ncbi:uncharacterized protein [Euphorbia lathyris]|uniref:uncharacterized protein n=1 Tax=Euphorbia lathyris TaxID=212925 RepID=UPI0033142217